MKVWDAREYRNLDDSVELGTRNIKIALRKLRRFAREGAADELDLDGTIDATARNAGLLDLKLRAGAPQRGEGAAVPRRRRLDGRRTCSVCEELFSAARSEFKHLEYFYFHNFVVRAAVEGQPAPSRRAHHRRSRSCARIGPTTA